MEAQVLINNSEMYSGQFVAKKTFLDKTVIANGYDFDQVYDDAVRKGASDPVVFFVPNKEMAYIY
jgi:hypothetical protein